MMVTKSSFPRMSDGTCGRYLRYLALLNDYCCRSMIIDGVYVLLMMINDDDGHLERVAFRE
jgi:hypothetical protein